MANGALTNSQINQLNEQIETNTKVITADLQRYAGTVDLEAIARRSATLSGRPYVPPSPGGRQDPGQGGTPTPQGDIDARVVALTRRFGLKATSDAVAQVDLFGLMEDRILPEATPADNGQVATIVAGAWAKATPPAGPQGPKGDQGRPWHAWLSRGRWPAGGAGP